MVEIMVSCRLLKLWYHSYLQLACVLGDQVTSGQPFTPGIMNVSTVTTCIRMLYISARETTAHISLESSIALIFSQK